MEIEPLLDLLEYQESKNEQRHKDLILTMSKLLGAIPKEVPDNSEYFERLIKIMGTFDLKDESTPNAIRTIGDAILKKIEESSKLPAKKLDVVRVNGLIDHVNIIR